MRQVSRQELQEQAQRFAREHIEHLLTFNNQVRSAYPARLANVRPFVEPNELVRTFEHLYMRFVARNQVITP